MKKCLLHRITAFLPLYILMLLFVTIHQASGENVVSQESPICLAPTPNSIEIMDKRTQQSKTYRNPDGTYTWISTLNEQPLHYQDIFGKWEDIHPTLEKNTILRGFNYAMLCNTFHAYFPANLSKDTLVRFQDGDSWVTYELSDPHAESNAVVNDNSITYPLVYPNTDIQYVMHQGIAKQCVILHQYSRKSSFRFKLSLHNITPYPSDEGGLIFKEKDVSHAWSFPKPIMWDSANDTGSVEAHLEKTKGDFFLVVTADAKWLSDANRKYPVIIDPTWGGSSKACSDNASIFKGAASTTHSTSNLTISGANNSKKVCRVLVKWDLTGAPTQDQIVHSADSCRVTLYEIAGTTGPKNVELHKSTKSWAGSSVTWNIYGDSGYDPTVLATTSMSSTNVSYTWSYDGSSQGFGLPDANGFLLKSADENDSLEKECRNMRSGTTNCPTLAVDYDLQTLDAPTNLSVQPDYSTFTGGTCTWSKPLGATAYDVALGSVASAEDLGIQSVTANSITLTSLTPGKIYYVKVRARSDLLTSNWCDSKPLPMSIIIESRSGGFNNQWYSDSNLQDSSLESTANGLMATGSRIQANSGSSSNGTAIFTPTISMAGYYRVFATYPLDSSVQANHLLITVNHTYGSNLIYRDENGPVRGGSWVNLGYYHFDTGNSQTISVTNSQTTSMDGLMCVDAIQLSPIISPEIAWIVPTGGAVESSPTVDSGVGYCGSDDGKVYAINISDGSLKWTSTLDGEIKSRVALYDSKLYLTSTSGKVYCLSADTGEIVWSSVIGGNSLTSTPAVHDGRLFVGSDDGNLYKINALDGSNRISISLGAPISASPSVPPFADGGLIIIGTDTGTLYGIQSTDSEFSILWTCNLGTGVTSSPTTDWQEGTLYVGYDSGVAKRVLSNGNFIWSFSSCNPVRISPWMDPILDMLYIMADNGNVWKLDSVGGHVIGGYPQSVGTKPFYGSPVVIPGVWAGNYLYAGSENGFLEMNISSPCDYYLYPGVFSSSPSISGITMSDVVVVGCSDKNIYGFRLR